MPRPQFDLFSSCNPAGWFHYYLAHLIENSGMRDKSLVEVITWACKQSQEAREWDYEDNRRPGDGSAPHPEWRQRYMSDNQCVMITNHWFYLFSRHQTGTCPHCGAVRDIPALINVQGVTFEIDITALNYWQEMCR